RADGTQRSALVAIKFVDAFTVQHEFPFVSPRHFEAFEKHIPRIMLAIVRHAFLITVAAVVDIRAAGIAIARVEPVEHAFLLKGSWSKSRRQAGSRYRGLPTCSFIASYWKSTDGLAAAQSAQSVATMMERARIAAGEPAQRAVALLDAICLTSW